MAHKLLLGRTVLEAVASCMTMALSKSKLELREAGSQAGVWEPVKSRTRKLQLLTPYDLSLRRACDEAISVFGEMTRQLRPMRRNALNLSLVTVRAKIMVLYINP